MSRLCVAYSVRIEPGGAIVSQIEYGLHMQFYKILEMLGGWILNDFGVPGMDLEEPGNDFLGFLVSGNFQNFQKFQNFQSFQDFDNS